MYHCIIVPHKPYSNLNQKVILLEIEFVQMLIVQKQSQASPYNYKASNFRNLSSSCAQDLSNKTKSWLQVFCGSQMKIIQALPFELNNRYITAI